MVPRYETTVIEGEALAWTEKNTRTREDVAHDVTRTYTKVSQEGGRIVAGHSISTEDTEGTSGFLLLVAEYPDAPDPNRDAVRPE